MTKYLVLIFFLAGCTSGARYSLWESNDYFKPTKNNDKDFSQGAEFSAEYPNEKGSRRYFGGQTFYTPPNKGLTTIQPDERPYAAYLYVGSDFKFRRSETLEDTFGLQLGVVGPNALGKEAQNGVHRLLDQNTAKGWDNGIDNDIGVILRAERAYALPISNKSDSIHSLGTHLGNVFTQVYAGSLLRYGYNLPDHFLNPGLIFPRAPREPEVPKKWSVWGFAGPYVKAVALNVFLDGNSDSTDDLVDKKPFVAEGRLGFAVEYTKYRFGYTYVIQTAEYDTQDPGNDFGNLDLSFRW